MAVQYLGMLAGKDLEVAVWSCVHASASECVYTYMCMHTLLGKKGFQMA